MMTMMKMVLLMLVVFKATALESSHEIESSHELHSHSAPTPLPCPPQASSDADEKKQSTVLCAVQCVTSCQDKKSFQKILCIGICLGKCLISPTDSIDELACAVDCAHKASTNNLRSDANMMNEHISSCNQLCKRE